MYLRVVTLGLCFFANVLYITNSKNSRYLQSHYFIVSSFYVDNSGDLCFDTMDEQSEVMAGPPVPQFQPQVGYARCCKKSVANRYIKNQATENRRKECGQKDYFCCCYCLHYLLFKDGAMNFLSSSFIFLIGI